MLLHNWLLYKYNYDFSCTKYRVLCPYRAPATAQLSVKYWFIGKNIIKILKYVLYKMWYFFKSLSYWAPPFNTQACFTVLVPAHAVRDEMCTVVVSSQSCDVDTSGFRTGKLKENIYKWVSFNQNYAVWNIRICMWSAL